jgi:hypothetical protein
MTCSKKHYPKCIYIYVYDNNNNVCEVLSLSERRLTLLPFAICFCELPALNWRDQLTTVYNSIISCSLHYASSVFVGWARDDGSSIAVWPRPRTGEEHDNEGNRAYEIECIWKQKGRFRAAALKTLVIDHCETGASMQVGLVSRSCPPPPARKKKTPHPWPLPPPRGWPLPPPRPTRYPPTRSYPLSPCC